MGGGGANLNYTDDDLESYSTIWEGEVTKTGKSDHRRVVTALKNISEGTDLEKYLDVDNVLKYMAVHTFSVNMDSLSGSMAHNYYLYEYDGRLNIFPWDYNLSLGGMAMGNDADATEVVNDAIDTPFSGTNFFDALLSNEEYLERYHAYLRQLVDEYVNGGRFDEVYNRIRNQIDSLVETDPTAFYPCDEYQTAAEILYETVKLRAESIDGQLNGTIPSTDDGQRRDSSSLIDASHIDLAAMGKFSMGGSDDFKGRSDRMNRPSGPWKKEESSPENGLPGGSQENPPENVNPPESPDGFDPGSLPDGFDPGNLPDGFDAGNLPDGFNPNGMPGGGSGFGGGNMPGGVNPGSGSMPGAGGSSPGTMPNTGGSAQPGSENSDPKGEGSSGSGKQNGATPGGSADTGQNRPSSFSGMPGQTSSKLGSLIVIGVCFAVMIAALFVVGSLKHKEKR